MKAVYTERHRSHDPQFFQVRDPAFRPPECAFRGTLGAEVVAGFSGSTRCRLSHSLLPNAIDGWKSSQDFLGSLDLYPPADFDQRVRGYFEAVNRMSGVSRHESEQRDPPARDGTAVGAADGVVPCDVVVCVV